MSGDYYIVTTRRYRRFETPEAAQSEANGFKARFPSERPKVIRCKTKLQRANHYAALINMVQAFVTAGVTGDNLERARALLEAVKHRHPEVTP